MQAIEEATTTVEKITFEELRSGVTKIYRGELTVEEIKALWQRFNVSKEDVTNELEKLTKKELAKLCGQRPGEKKECLVEWTLNRLMSYFAPGNSVWYEMNESYEDGVARKLETWTPELIAKAKADYEESVRERRERYAKYDKAIENPETLEEFDIKIHLKGEDSLTAEELIKFDELAALAGRKKRQALKEKQAAIAETQLEEAELTLHKTYHTKKHYDLWVVKLSDRVERAKYVELNERAKRLNGRYSSYNKDGAIPGFQFRTEETAKQFMALNAIDGKERVEERELTRREKAIAHITEVATNLKQESRAIIYQERQVNTHRRLTMAENITANASRNLQLAGTMLRVADALGDAEVQWIDRLRCMTEFETFETILSNAKWARAKQANESWDKVSYRSPELQDIEFAEFPYPSIHRSFLVELCETGLKTSGLKLIAARLIKHLAKTSTYVVEFKTEKQFEDLNKMAMIIRRNSYALESLKTALLPYKRMLRLDLRNSHEVRTALREYLAFRGNRRQVDPVLMLERRLLLQRIPSLFPTPKKVVAQMMELADLKPGMNVLEPEVGTCKLADAAAEIVGKELVQTVEINSSLVELIKLKGYENVVHGDFLEYYPKNRFDCILMNPPFEKGEDIEHTQYAYEYCLAVGGRMVVVVCANYKYRQDKKYEAFRTWLKMVGAVEVDVPANAFKESDRPTGTAVKILVINRPNQ